MPTSHDVCNLTNVLGAYFVRPPYEEKPFVHTLSGNPSLDIGRGHMATKDGKGWVSECKTHSPKSKSSLVGIFPSPKSLCRQNTRKVADGRWSMAGGRKSTAGGQGGSRIYMGGSTSLCGGFCRYMKNLMDGFHTHT